MSSSAVPSVDTSPAASTTIIRPIRGSDVAELGRVHAQCWHETYDHLISAAALARLSPRRMAELWSNLANRGSQYAQFAALVDGEIVGFVGSGPARDADAPRKRELIFLYLLEDHHGRGIGQRLFDAACGTGPVYLWVASDNPRAHRFYERNGFVRDGAEQLETFLGEQVHEVRFVR